MENDKIIKIKLKKITIVENEDVFDLTVEKNHNFFANGLLVHNCAEASLRPFTFCNLVTINGGENMTQEEFNNRCRVASFIATLQASYTDYHYLRDIWKKNTEKDSLIGISVTGIAHKDFSLLDKKESVKIVLEENERVSKLIGINKANRTTLEKPDGTTSLVLGTASGIHSWHSKYYKRRVRVGKDETIYQYLSYNNPELLEDDFFKPKTQAIITLPIEAPDGSIFRGDETAIEFLNRIKTFTKEWIVPGHRKGANMNNVSATVTVKDNEWDSVGEWCWKNKKFYTALSFLPYDGHSYVQAPFEEIDENTYFELKNSLKDFDIENIIEYSDETELQGEVACAGGACLI